jgi:hypothetical protein
MGVGEVRWIGAPVASWQARDVRMKTERNKIQGVYLFIIAFPKTVRV